jgi:predicted ATPase/class 3 adenylate cyclase
MGERNEMFGRLLRGAINSIAAYEGKTAAIIEDELGAQIGLAGTALQRYKAGHLPADLRTIQILAQAGIQRGFLGTAWLQRFLTAAHYPNPAPLLEQFASTLAAAESTRNGSTTSGLPSGTVIFLFTDIEGSTRAWEQYPQAMQQALARHNAILQDAIAGNGGSVFKTVGDAFCAAFPTAHTGVSAALAAQRAILAERWGEVGPLRIRMALHAATAQADNGDYLGPPLNRVARLCAAGAGGQILLSLATQELVYDNLPADVSLLDLGQHRLKDLGRPEHIFQLVAPDLPQTFPPLKTLDNRANNLPVQPTPLIGRETEVATVRDLLHPKGLTSRGRLLTLTGPGGVGKTRLALQVAADLLYNFADGVCFVSLAAYRDPHLVTKAIAQSLGVEAAGSQLLIEQLKTALRYKELLLVLDNFEQVLEAAPLVAELLAAAPSLTVLVTSRIVLKLYGECEYTVPSLSLPDARHIPPMEQLTQYEAVQLFLARAQAVKSDFAINQENAPAVAQICVRLDGLPLAIELAAARIKLFQPQALLTRLDNRLKLLVGGARNLPSRQQTLRSAIDWSYDLLDETEQTLFAQLGVFVSGASLEAVEAVCQLADGLDVLSGLTSLVDKSLLRQLEGYDGDPRFVMLETIREYALERLLASDQAAAIRQRHLDFYVTLAEQADVNLSGTASPVLFKRLDPDYDNFRAALGWALQSGEIETGLRLAVAWSWYWLRRNDHREGAQWLEELLAKTSTAPTRLRAQALYYSGQCYQRLGNYPQMRAAYEEGLSIARLLGEPRLLAYALVGAYLVADHLGDRAKAAAYAAESLELWRQLGDTERVARAVIGLGNDAMGQGKYHEARPHFEEGLALYRQLNIPWGIAFALLCLGSLCFMQGDDETAWNYLQESLTIIDEEWSTDADVLGHLGDIARYRGDYDQARQFYNESLTLWRSGHWAKFVARELYHLGQVACHQQAPDEAIVLFQESLGLYRKLDLAIGIALCLVGLAGVALLTGEPETAAQLLAVAEREFQANNVRLNPADRRDYDTYRTLTANHLTEEAFAAAWSTGQAMTQEQAIAKAMRLSASQPQRRPA